MGELKDHLSIPTIDEPKPKAPFIRATEFDGSKGFIQTEPLASAPNWDEVLEMFGYDPKEVRIVGTLRTSKWQQREDGEWLHSYRFAIGPAATANLDDVIKSISTRKFKPAKSEGDDVFHWLAGDLQLGKIDGDGTQGVVDRVLASIDNGVKQLKTLRRFNSIGMVHQAWLGDCGEGNQSQGGKSMWRTELTITEQYRLFRRLALYAVDAFAPLVERLEIDVVNGNHDEAQRLPVATRADDGHATEAMIALADALLLNPSSYGHVRIFVPNRDEMTITREIGNSVFTHAHGNQWAKGKAFEWWSKQALNNHSAGAADFLLHGHNHEMHLQAKKERVVLCVPTFESESTYWKHRHGDVARTGALVMLTNGKEFRELSII
jgi:predicted phosphodiesterase